MWKPLSQPSHKSISCSPSPRPHSSHSLVSYLSFSSSSSSSSDGSDDDDVRRATTVVDVSASVDVSISVSVCGCVGEPVWEPLVSAAATGINGMVSSATVALLLLPTLGLGGLDDDLVEVARHPPPPPPPFWKAGKQQLCQPLRHTITLFTLFPLPHSSPSIPTRSKKLIISLSSTASSTMTMMMKKKTIASSSQVSFPNPPNPLPRSPPSNASYIHSKPPPPPPLTTYVSSLSILTCPQASSHPSFPSFHPRKNKSHRE